MTRLKDQIEHTLGLRATAKMAVLADRYVCSAPEQREAIQAELAFERWLAETCSGVSKPDRNVKIEIFDPSA